MCVASPASSELDVRAVMPCAAALRGGAVPDALRAADIRMAPPGPMCLEPKRVTAHSLCHQSGLFLRDGVNDLRLHGHSYEEAKGRRL